MTFEEAIDHAARLLREAEIQADLHRMERFEKLADSWTSIAHIIHQHVGI